MTKNNYNTSQWEEFLLFKIFDIDFGNKFDFNKMAESRRMDVAFVSRTASNNGVCGWVEPIDGVVPYPAGSITVALGGSIGSTFVQPKQFYTGQNVAVLKDKKNGKTLTREEKLFVAMLIRKECESRFVAFGRELNKHIKTDFTIRLPAVNKEKIDWDKLKQLSKGIIAKLSFYTSNEVSPLPSIECWKKFKIKTLFKTNESGKLPRGKVHSKEDLPDGFDYYYIGAKKRDNGIMYRCGYDDNLISKGNCIVFICNGQGSVGYTNYVDTDFMASGDLALGYNDSLNKYNALFLVTVLDKERFKYSFGRKWGKYLSETEILLPAKGDEPDWQLMEEYIKSMPYGDIISKQIESPTHYYNSCATFRRLRQQACSSHQL